MSSRLMTMKFMQRSAAKSVNSEPSTPDGPPSKRMRMSNSGSAASTPGAPSDREIMQSALAAEEKKREEALARAYAHTGETKWELSYKDPYAGKRAPMMQVRQAGFAVIDADNDSDEEEEDKPIRMKFGGGLKKKKAAKPDLVKVEGSGSGSESDSESSSGEIESDDPTAELIRETKREVSAKERNARRAQKAAAVTPVRRTGAPIDEDMDLAGLTSLSGGRPNAGRDMSKVECYGCGKFGHTKADCPNPGRRPSGPPGMRGSRDRGRMRY
ncbi:uncharacterized protein N0V89_010360 [Didymosphaeria variabile]|uniref:CCHC-type domain-containing protein n=1 Tax=Didymosphaeria variabile TaxID=1932322 RepID=A0A9W9C620_9PLEO|nr:uncharacterized protein N0V89_010360 [Didymosphaeria variabile]KAJ4346431.1 hypothetical protein N0V89_010360 [Didymosphaeria variabile]